MELSAYTRSIKDILSLKRRYVIPRFQREYSWGEDELTVLWTDILSNLIVNDYEKKLVESEYFIGSVVLVGDDSKDSDFYVVDGQQRLTTITIFFAALVETFNQLGQDSLAKGAQNYIETVNDDNEPFLILLNENPKPFLQFRIQQSKKDVKQVPRTDEEKALLFAYDFFIEKLEEQNLLKDLNRRFKLGLKDQDYIDVLKAIRNQVLAFITIYITVKDEDDAYLIFETLNAKGKDLEAIDLIKNQIFKKIKTTAAGDFPKESWTETRNLLVSREDKINMSQFYRHFWLAKYSFVRDAGLYDDFKKRVIPDEENYKVFLEELKDAAKNYIRIASPSTTDWKQMEDKYIFEVFSALKIFGVTQPRPLLLVLLDLKEHKKIKQSDLKRVIIAIEKFHFIYTAIVSSRASNIESKYSTFARQLNNAKNKNEVTTIISEIVNYFKSNIPAYNEFQSGFLKLYYTKTYTTDKKIIQYILKKFEDDFYSTEELTTNIISIEHIMNESDGIDEVGLIGNLLPLDKKLNSSIGDMAFEKKLVEYNKSNLKSVKAFVSVNTGKSKWTIADIESRGKELAKLAYNHIWKI
ncbi:DUF262 domain-containing protein [Paenibacillus phocaensis]|uniref:DUF262 domain-containing protein n=1 Tax=Paenibacillus phocaensis TaxID=1776378 RepID=UPI000839C742|nr:DUF262 domain-containing protein [Paenibacillus phocaensis]